MSTTYDSGTVGGVGYGNKTSDDPNFDGHEETRFGSHKNEDPYSGATDYGSGATGGAGFGNKTNGAADLSETDLRFGENLTDAPYSGQGPLGSGSTAGAGYGNKTSSGHGEDSTAGKLMEKVGHVLHSEKLVEKGQARREAAGSISEGTAEALGLNNEEK